MPAKQGRSFTFTVNNYAEDDIEKLRAIDWIAYCRVGKEVGESGTPHLQGYIQRKRRVNGKDTKWSAAKCAKLLKEAGLSSQPHCEVAMGGLEANQKYCAKEGDWTEWGEPSTERQRTDIKEFIAKASKVRTPADEKALKDEMPGTWARYYKAGREAAKLDQLTSAMETLNCEYKDAELRPWQQKLLERVERQSTRTVTWAWEPEGNTGKTWMANWLATQRKAFLVEGGKVADIAHAYNCQEWVVFDLTRSSEEHSAYIYSVIESFKNGRIFSPKYESAMKMFKPCKVVVFANWEPERERLSADRWDIVNVGEHPLWRAVRKTAEKRKRAAMEEDDEDWGDEDPEIKRARR